jgi:hypothetical protein
MKSILSLFLGALCAALISGCGVKAPPLPPGRGVLPPVEELGNGVEGERLRLSWKMPEKRGVREPDLAGFIVFRFKQPLTVPACGDCPLVFERVADLKMAEGSEKKDGRVSYVYEEILEKGFRYRFKVTAYGSGGERSPDSAVVGFDI